MTDRTLERIRRGKEKKGRKARRISIYIFSVPRIMSIKPVKTAIGRRRKEGRGKNDYGSMGELASRGKGGKSDSKRVQQRKKGKRRGKEKVIVGSGRPVLPN